MVGFGPSFCRREKVVVLGQKWLYFCKSGYIREKVVPIGKVVVLGQTCCISAKVVVFGEKLSYSGKSGCIRVKWLYSGKSCCIRAKMVLFGQRWLCSCKEVLLRQKWLFSGKNGCKWFEPRSISSSCSVIVRVSVVLKRTVGDSD